MPIVLTPDRSAGRIEDVLWDAFLRKARRERLSNTDALREALHEWITWGSSEPAPRWGHGLAGLARYGP
jgi:hypothetical protein